MRRLIILIAFITALALPAQAIAREREEVPQDLHARWNRRIEGGDDIHDPSSGRQQGADRSYACI